MGKEFKIIIKFPSINISLKTIFLLSFFLSIISWVIFYLLDLTTVYNDARAHLNMARLVVDNLKPGFAQMGGVWLPLNHLLMLPFIWNDWMWHSGLAGSLFSMIFYILSSITLFKLFNKFYNNNIYSVIGTLVFMFNLNVLYMQSTPMTELPLIYFFVSSTYFLYLWTMERKVTDLLLVGLFTFLSVITRYDGWFLMVWNALIIGVFLIKEYLKDNNNKQKDFSVLVNIIKKNFGIIVFYLTLAVFGIILWILWNVAIFKNPLYFAYGPYSAHAQQEYIDTQGLLYTKYNILLSLSAYWWSVADNVGLFILVVAIAGLYLFTKNMKMSNKSLAIYTLLTPAIFHIVSLYLGHSVLVMPEIDINVEKLIRGGIFNARYGLMIVPATGFFFAYLFSRAKDAIIKIIIILVALIQTLLFLGNNGIITIVDGSRGTSSLNVNEASNFIKNELRDKDDLILMSFFNNSSLAFSSDLSLKRFIHEGTGTYWETSMKDPSIYADWIVMSTQDVGDPVYNNLVKENNSKFLRHYELLKEYDDRNIYKRVEYPQNVAYTKNGKILVNNKQYNFIGINSYDLILRTPGEIASTLSSAKDSGFKVVRFWVFGEGEKNLIQPKPGVYNQDLIIKLDYILATANKIDLKVILTLSNYWEAYGGVRQYLKWVDLPSEKPEDLDRFYTDERIRNIYMNFVKHVVTRENSFSKEKYVDDPTIMAWELMNEPRSSSSLTSNVVIEWIKEMTDYIKTLDKYHLIMTGHEGFVKDIDVNPSLTSPSINEIDNIFEIDTISGHYYLGNFVSDKPVTDFEILDIWSDYAKTSGNAFFIEEIGFSKNSSDNNGIDRYTLYDNLLKRAKKNDVQGIILWNWALKIDNNYGISPLDPGDEKLIKLFKSYSEEISSKKPI